MFLPTMNFLHLTVSRYGPDKIFKVKVTTARLKVKSRLNYDVAHLHPQPMFLPKMNFLHLAVSKIWLGQDFSMSRSL